MKVFGSISELVSTVFRKNSQAITLRPNQTTTYTAARDIQTPPQNADSILVSETATQALSNKTMGSTNTLTGVTLASITNTGTVTFPTATDTLVARTTTDTLTNKTLTSPTITGATSTAGSFTGIATLSLDDTDSAFNLAVQSTSTLTANRTVTLDAENNDRLVRLAGDLIIAGNFSTSGVNPLTLTTTATTTVTLPTTGTLATLAGSETFTNKTLTTPTISNPTVTDMTLRGTLLLQNTSGAQPQLQLSEDPDNGTDKITIQAPASLAANYTLTLPVDDGTSGQVLSTDGSGVLSWAAASSGGVSREYQYPTGTWNASTTASSTTFASGTQINGNLTAQRSKEVTFSDNHQSGDDFMVQISYPSSQASWVTGAGPAWTPLVGAFWQTAAGIDNAVMPFYQSSTGTNSMGAGWSIRAQDKFVINLGQYISIRSDNTNQRDWSEFNDARIRVVRTRYT